MQAQSRAAAHARTEQPTKLSQPSAVESSITAPQVEPSAPQAEKKRSKRKHRAEDDIDRLFDEKLGKKVKKAALDKEATDGDAQEKKEDDVPSRKHKKDKSGEQQPDGLKDVLGAIKAAPKGEDGHRVKKKK